MHVSIALRDKETFGLKRIVYLDLQEMGVHNDAGCTLHLGILPGKHRLTHMLGSCVDCAAVFRGNASS